MPVCLQEALSLGNGRILWLAGLRTEDCLVLREGNGFQKNGAAAGLHRHVIGAFAEGQAEKPLLLFFEISEQTPVQGKEFERLAVPRHETHGEGM